MVISVIQDDRLYYPNCREYFSPSENYPEYRFTHIASTPNLVYRALRDCLANAGLDRANFGKPSWNPLKDHIPSGSNAFILCNLVCHKLGHETWGDFSAKCTHGSVLRAIIDYVLLAVGRHGTIAFGNAPIQSCKWESVLKETGVSTVTEFYKKNGYPTVEPYDLRSYIVKRHLLGGFTPISEKGAQDEISIDLGSESLLEELYTATHIPEFRSTDYDPNLIRRFHERGKHVYTFNKRILEADIIISLTKLKTHEKAGVSLGLKGCIGGISHKNCLVHCRLGPPSRGGDEFPEGEVLNLLESKLSEFTNIRRPSGYTRFLRAALFILRKAIIYSFDKNVGGGWAGNDTTWRMGLDVARALKYSDVNGALSTIEQRKILSFIDGIIAGEGNGPLRPLAKRVGYLSFCDDLACGDFIAAHFMGLDPESFPIIKQAFAAGKFPITQVKTAEIEARVNGLAYNQEKLASLGRNPLKLPAGWRKKEC